MTKVRRELVEAGAGCGKTTGLVARYIEGLGYLEFDEKLKATGGGFHPPEIFALTFTIEAAEQMKEKILDKLRKHHLDSIFTEVFQRSQISTFHSLCLRLLRPELFRLGYGDELHHESAASYRRKAFALQYLADFPDGEGLLRSLPLEEILALTTKLWYSPTLETDSGEVLRNLRESLQSFENFKKDLLQETQDILIRYNEEIASSSAKNLWPLDLVAGLQESNREKIASLQFRALKKIKDAEVDYFKKVSHFRDFAKGPFWPSLNEKSLREEWELETTLKSFILACRDQGPRILDFAALEYEFLMTLRESSQKGERIVPAPKLLLVDEFQDTNKVQMEILEHLSGVDTEWYFVGDPKQSIYAFRRSDVSLFIAQREKLQLIAKDENYRSHPQVLDFINPLQHALFDPRDRLDPPAQTLKVPESRLSFCKDTSHCRVSVTAVQQKTSSKENIFRELAAEISRNRKTFGPKARHAVLFQRWSTLRAFAEHLRKSGETYEILGSEAYLDHLLTDIFCDYLTSLDDKTSPRGNLAVDRWTRGYQALQNPELRELKAQDPLEALESFSNEIDCRRFPLGREWLSAMTQFLRQLLASENAWHFGLPELIWMIRNQGKFTETDLPHAPQSAEKSGRIQLMTIHGSKGLQFECVYLPDLFEKRSGPRSQLAEFDDSAGFNFMLEDRESGEARGSLLFLYREAQAERLRLAEQKRLLYVALTRSIESLHLFYRKGAHTRKEAALNSTLRILQWPEINALYWNDFIEKLETNGTWDELKKLGNFRYQALVAEDEETKASESHAATQDTDQETWIQIPPQKHSPRSPNEFYRMGVSRYLKLTEDEEVAKDEETSGLRPRFRASETGDAFHALLEIWDGRMESLDDLLGGEKHAPLFREALGQLRALPELQFFWTDLSKGRVLREFGLFLLTEKFRLSGFADALWFPADGGAVILDWKSSSSIHLLKKEERLQKIRRQLGLYASALARSNRPSTELRLMVVGIELNKKSKVEVLINEAFAPAEYS